jgi:DNA-binding transcriptional regulator YiaG
MIAPESVEPQQIDTTATSSVTEVLVPIPQTLTFLVRQVSDLRDRVQETSSEVADLNRRVNATDLDRRTHFKVREGVPILLDEIASEAGMSWNDLARSVGVSPQAVRKWRQGEPATGENRLALARLAAFIDLLSELGIGDPAVWLEVPLISGYSIRGLDLYAAGKIDLLLEWANMRIDSPERLLELFDSKWRDKYHTSHETFKAGDGNLSIRRRTK